jgi:hypothetical protein
MTLMLDLTQDIQSLTTFFRRAGDSMKQLKKSKRPVILRKFESKRHGARQQFM